MPVPNGRIRAVFFDLGKVLLDFRHDDIVERLLSRSDNAKEKAPELFRFLFDRHEGLCNLYDEGNISSENFFKAIDARFGLGTDFEGFSASWNGIFRENKEMSRLMGKIRERMPVFLLSNVNELHWEHARREFPMLSQMDGWVLSCEVKAKKPSPEIYAAALRAAGLGYGESVFIDDLEENIRAAEEHGIRGIVFTGYGFVEQKMREYGIIEHL